MTTAEVLKFDDTRYLSPYLKGSELLSEMIISPQLSEDHSHFHQEVVLENDAVFRLAQAKKQGKPHSGDIFVGGETWSPGNMRMDWGILIDGLTAADRDRWIQRLDTVGIYSFEHNGVEIDLTYPDVALTELVRAWARLSNRAWMVRPFIDLLAAQQDERFESMGVYHSRIGARGYTHPFIKSIIHDNLHRKDLYVSLGNYINKALPRQLTSLYNWRNKLSKWYVNGPFADGYIITDYRDTPPILILSACRADIFARAKTTSRYDETRINDIINVNVNEFVDDMIVKRDSQSTPAQRENARLKKTQNQLYSSLPTSCRSSGGINTLARKVLANQGPMIVDDTHSRSQLSITLASDGSIFDSYTKQRTEIKAKRQIAKIEHLSEENNLVELLTLILACGQNDDGTSVWFSNSG